MRPDLEAIEATWANMPALDTATDGVTVLDVGGCGADVFATFTDPDMARVMARARDHVRDLLAYARELEGRGRELEDGVCRECKGRGQAPCYLCEGVGYTTTDMPECFGGGTARRDCGRCGGTGVAACLSCDGTGRVAREATP